MRWLSCALVLSAATLFGCGAGGSAGDFTSGPPDGGLGFGDATTTNLLLDSGRSTGPKCTPRTCTQIGADCGPVADGCGDIVDCGKTCAAGQACGGGGVPNVCGGGPACVPKTCADPSVASLCGPQADGCGGLIADPCVTCAAPQTCGGGGPGTPSKCGGDAGCVPYTKVQACAPSTPSGIPMNCGIQADGCGGIVTCGPLTCPPGESCGGAGIPNVCGSSTITPLSDGGVSVGDSGTICVPVSLSTACAGTGGVPLCGYQSDGCGGSLLCPTTCVAPDTCGGGGASAPSVCGHPPCTPRSQSTACADPAGGTYCGLVGDGCSSTISCPACTVSGDTCGGGATPSVCGQPVCHPLTACPGGANCGLWPNGCGGTITCGSLGGACTPPDICGGGGVPSQCGDGTAGGTACDAGLKCNLTKCDGGTLATLKGQVFDPAGLNPLYNVVVYVPNATPSTISHGNPSCDSCSSLYTGDPITSTTTDTDGNFVLTGVPVPPNGLVPVVIQLGKWRRQMIWPSVTPCAVNTAAGATAGLLKLPGAETTTLPTAAGATLDDLPQIAVSTGAADSMECLLERIGFAASEYVGGWNATSGHIHIFSGTPIPAAKAAADVIRDPATTSPVAPGSSASLWDTDADLNHYDILVLSCEGEETVGAIPQNLEDFSSAGGRVFTSHFHYSWLSGPIVSSETYTAPSDWGTNLATWSGNSNAIFNATTNLTLANNVLNANIVEKIADGGTPMKTWLGNVNALGGSAPAGELFIEEPRFNAQVTVTNTASQNWIVPDDGPYWYADVKGNLHALPANSTQYFSFNTPTGGTGDVSAAYCGRVVFSDLHVGAAANDYASESAVGDVPTVPADCASGALTPQEKALEYMLLDLASCPSSDTNLPIPTPPTCTEAVCPSNWCGPYPNGCGDGGFLNCGSCEAGADCINGACVSCKPLTACPKDAGVSCGAWPDGCGGTISCGTCPEGTCVHGACVTGCNPQPCPPTITCGATSNGCGGLTADCGSCTGGATCGGGGTPGACGQSDGNACVPQKCPADLMCGKTGDGCGGVIDCGECKAPDTCGGGGTPGVCGAPNCTPSTCASLAVTCGQVADGCGGLTPICGTCTGSQTCGGGGVANECGLPQCMPSTCASLGLNCGEAGDGCGSILQCGQCTAPDTCGGAGVANVCGPGAPK